MIIFLYGQDTYRSRQKLNEIIEHYKKTHKSGLNLRYLDGKKLSYRDFEDELRQVPMFNEKKLVILKNTLSNQEFKNSFLKNSKKFIESNDIIIFHEEGEVPQNGLLFKFFKKNAEIQEFKLLGGQKLRNWLKKEFEGYGVKIEPAALEKLIFFLGSDLWQLSQETKKLTAFKNGKEVGVKDVELLVKPKIATDIFQTVDAVALKNKKQALSLIRKHLEKGDSPLYLLAMINFQFRNLLIIKGLIEKHQPYYSILKASKLHPFVAKKSYQQANLFTLQELKKIYQKIFQVDYNIKTGRLDPQTALDLLIAEI